jgi:hypothetical protein
MPDYGHEIEFGYFLVPDAGDPESRIRTRCGPSSRRSRRGSASASRRRVSISPETDRGRAMFEELLWVHSIIRRDLEIVEQLAADADEGLPGEAVQDTPGVGRGRRRARTLSGGVGRALVL